MTPRLSRAKMCSWLSGELGKIKVYPFNPADIQQLSRNARDADKKLRKLTMIADELGWHVDADLDLAFTLIQEYEAEFEPPSLREE